MTFELQNVSNTLILAAVSLMLTGCSSVIRDEVNMMPPPDVYGNGMLNPLPEQYPMDLIPYQGLLYATDRLSASPDDKEKYYANDREHVVRLGVAQISLHEADVNWAEVREISLPKKRMPKRFT